MARPLVVALVTVILAAAALAAAVFDARRAEVGVWLACGGDVLLDRGVAAVIADRGPDAPLAGIASLVRAADIAFCNLECPLARGGTPQVKRFVFRGRPEWAAALARAGFDVASLANNHSLDWGPSALADTVDALAEAGVRPCGVRDAGQPQVPAIIDAGGMRVAFLAFTAFGGAEAGAPAGAGGDCLPDPAQLDRVAAAVRAARPSCDALVVSFHFGNEYSPVPDAMQRAMAYCAADAGADLVVGHHPHVVQGLQWRGGCLIAYSLGDLVFDGPAATRETVLLRCRLAPAGDAGARGAGGAGGAVVEARLVPLVIADCCPWPAAGAAGERILRRITELSDALAGGWR